MAMSLEERKEHFYRDAQQIFNDLLPENLKDCPVFDSVLIQFFITLVCKEPEMMKHYLFNELDKCVTDTRNNLVAKGFLEIMVDSDGGISYVTTEAGKARKKELDNK